MSRLVAGSRRRLARRGVAAAAALCVAVGVVVSTAAGALPTSDDPRVGLSAGLENAGTAQLGVELRDNLAKPPGFFSPTNPGNVAFANSDLALQGDHAFVGNFNGFNIYDISDPADLSLVASVVCPGGQGDLSVFGNLLFMSVEESRARVDCGTNPAVGTRFQGVRIFDISNIATPVQVAAVQTCRGSHTHTLVEDPDDPNNVYIYVSGTAGVRPASTLAGCDGGPATNPNPSQWRIEVIKVPIANPAAAAVVSEPRLFRNEQTGALNGLQNAPQTPQHPSGMNWGPVPDTNSCHDITAFPALELAAGACEGNGLLIDISDPANPVRIDAVADPIYAYWHGATFSNDGTKVMFTDEWGGGTAARCRPTDDLSWGGNAIYEIVNGHLEFRSYYKLPIVQSNQQNCVSHIPSLVPVPGRDVFVQAWYQGGVSLVDWTDASNPVEIGYFDRGPISATSLVLGGLWNTYWFNGGFYGSEIARGIDAYGLTPTNNLSENEIAAASQVAFNRMNAQNQHQFDWEPSFAVVRSFRDQFARTDAANAEILTFIDKFIDRAEMFLGQGKVQAARAQLRALANELEGDEFADLREALRDLADSI